MSDIIAIDFGTSNSYFALYLNHNGKVESLSLPGTANNGIDSAVLYYTDAGKEHKEFGLSAFNMYIGSPIESIEQYQARLVTSFKPDIEFNEEAQTAAVDFLKNIREQFHNNNILKDLEGKTVYIGIPCDTTPGYRQKLREIAKEAGWGENVKLLPEPFGAVFYNTDDSLNFLEENILVIDFGGGTCDFTIIQKGSISNSWGDTFLGGRLFDDLFYQWSLEICQSNPNLQRPQDRRQQFNASRVTKEAFSNHLNQHNTPYPYQGAFSPVKMSRDEFERRCRNYTASDILKAVFTNLGEKAKNRSQFDPNRQMDLLKWFEDTLQKGFAEKNIDITSINRILLAGGSSCWYFVREICKKYLPKADLTYPKNVYSAIADGVANFAGKIIPSIEEKIKELENAETQDSTIEEIFNTEEYNNLFPAQKVRSAADAIFTEFVQPHLHNFRDKGGTWNSLEENIKNSFTENKSKITERTKEIAFNEYDDDVSGYVTRYIVEKITTVPIPRIEIQGFQLNLTDQIIDDLLKNLTVNGGISTFLFRLFGGGNRHYPANNNQMPDHKISQIREDFEYRFLWQCLETDYSLDKDRSKTMKTQFKQLINDILDQYRKILTMIDNG